MTEQAGWHRGNWRKHPDFALWLSWTHDLGSQIWQGRPFGGDTFVYRLFHVNGKVMDFRLLNDAKRAGAELPRDHRRRR